MTALGRPHGSANRTSAPRTTTCRPTGSSRASEWAKLRADTPMTLTADEVMRLQSLNDPISLEEVVAIYLPLSRLLSLYVAATQGLFQATQRFLLAENEDKVPYIIGVAGSVAVGKSTTARVLKALLARWPNTPEGRPRHHRRLPAAQRRADTARADGAQGLSRELRHRQAPALPRRHQGRQAQRRGAALLAPRLRRGAGRGDGGRPAGHPHRRRAERAPAGAACRRTARRSPSSRITSTSRSISTPTRTTCTAGT